MGSGGEEDRRQGGRMPSKKTFGCFEPDPGGRRRGIDPVGGTSWKRPRPNLVVGPAKVKVKVSIPSHFRLLYLNWLIRGGSNHFFHFNYQLRICQGQI